MPVTDDEIQALAEKAYEKQRGQSWDTASGPDQAFYLEHAKSHLVFGAVRPPPSNGGIKVGDKFRTDAVVTEVERA